MSRRSPVGGLVTWELRWTAAELPMLTEAWPTRPPDTSSSSALEDDDAYLLTRSPRVNLKLRRRTNTLKLKYLSRRSSEGFERWCTENDTPLPIGHMIAERTFGLLYTGMPIEVLSAPPTTEEALGVISSAVGPERIVEAGKQRQLYQRGSCVVDDVRLQVRTTTLRSIGVESTSVKALTALVSELATERIGTPRNYMQFLHAERTDKPVVLVWAKRLWHCPEPACGTGTWSEESDAIAPRSAMTERARATPRAARSGRWVAARPAGFSPFAWGLSELRVGTAIHRRCR